MGEKKQLSFLRPLEWAALFSSGPTLAPQGCWHYLSWAEYKLNSSPHGQCLPGQGKPFDQDLKILEVLLTLPFFMTRKTVVFLGQSPAQAMTLPSRGFIYLAQFTASHPDHMDGHREASLHSASEPPHGPFAVGNLHGARRERPPAQCAVMPRGRSDRATAQGSVGQ